MLREYARAAGVLASLPMISAESAPSSAEPQVTSLSRFSCCLATPQSKRRNGISNQTRSCSRPLPTQFFDCLNRGVHPIDIPADCAGGVPITAARSYRSRWAESRLSARSNRRAAAGVLKSPVRISRFVESWP
jgi:hypothetical protein